jgi:uncharacterized protein YydD (DUF2326 family)
LDAERSGALKILAQHETFEKFRELQQQTLTEKGKILDLQASLEQIDKVGTLKRQCQDTKTEILTHIRKIEDQTKHPPDRFIQIRRLFTSLARSILGTEAILASRVNNAGNIEFATRTLDDSLSGRETSEGAGASYGKMLAACFDLALLESYTDERFYRFVYHDGVFEGLDNRRKVDLLHAVRSFCRRTGCQYILTVIDTDLPRDARDDKLLFSEEDVIRSLHDDGDNGRLFRMRAF